MRKIGLFGGLALTAGLALAATPAAAQWWTGNQAGLSFGFGFGTPYYYGQYYPQTYSAPAYYYPQYGYDYYSYGYAGPQYSYPQTAYNAPVGTDHASWCRNRYRSYDIRTDSFTGYDGLQHRCVSPY